MPNPWHVVLWPGQVGELTAFVRWLTHTHSMRWHAHYHAGGTGHICQGRFKAFPVETDDHFYTVMRYVERNALRANLVGRAEEWRWGSLWRRQCGDAEAQTLLQAWPLARPTSWVELVNVPETQAELEAVRRSVARGRPYGSEAWCERTARQLGLQASLRPAGRPRKQADEGAAMLF